MSVRGKMVILLGTLVLMILVIINGSIRFYETKKKEGSFVHTAIAAAPNTYEEIGWRNVLGGGVDTESNCAYVIVSVTNATKDTKTFQKCWADNTSFPTMMRLKDGVPQAYILKVSNPYSVSPNFVVKRNAKITR